MPTIAAADGCKAGWVFLTRDLDSGEVTWRLCRTAREMFECQSIPQVIGIDIPIGLPEQGPRLCDLEAHQLLGRGRSSSVFPAPIRPILSASTYREACRIRQQVDGKQMSIQAWNIVGKICDVDAALRQDPVLAQRVHEVHPEISFYFLADQRRLLDGKKTQAGRGERCRLLEPVFGPWLQPALQDRKALQCAEDDILHAFAVLWTASRIAGEKSVNFPAVPSQDSFGLPMKITV